MTEHDLKVHPAYFRGLLTGDKTFEVRRNDRDPPFKVGDILLLREYDPAGRTYLGRYFRRKVTYFMDLGEIGMPGFVAMSIETPEEKGP